MNSEECVICLNNLYNLDNLDNSTNNIFILSCNHKLHIECLEKLKASKCPSKYKCPICRQPFKYDTDANDDNDANDVDADDANDANDADADDAENVYSRPSTPSSSPNLIVERYSETSIFNQIIDRFTPNQRVIPLPLVQLMLFSEPIRDIPL